MVLVRFLACDLGDDGSVCRLYFFCGVADCCEESLYFIWIGHHQFVAASLADLKPCVLLSERIDRSSHCLRRPPCYPRLGWLLCWVEVMVAIWFIGEGSNQHGCT